MDAIVRRGGIDQRQMVIGNTLFDLKKILACSALLAEGSRAQAAARRCSAGTSTIPRAATPRTTAW